HRGLAGRLPGNLHALVGLARNRRQAGRGGPHLAGSVAELAERLAHHTLELADIALDRLLPRHGAGVALALLRLDPDLVGGLLLEGLQRARQRADLVLARGIAGIDAEVAVRDLEHRVAHVVQRVMTRRATIIWAPRASASAPSSSTSSVTKERSAVSCSHAARSFAASRAPSATATAAARRPTVTGVHWFAVSSGF